MAKRKLPKKYLDNAVKEIITAINNLNNRLTSVESVFSTYVEWMKHEKKFKKYLEKKYKDNPPVQSKEK
jgi:DNA-binding transcriptional regulator GbsR (MarR family)